MQFPEAVGAEEDPETIALTGAEPDAGAEPDVGAEPDAEDPDEAGTADEIEGAGAAAETDAGCELTLLEVAVEAAFVQPANTTNARPAPTTASAGRL